MLKAALLRLVNKKCARMQNTSRNYFPAFFILLILISGFLYVYHKSHPEASGGDTKSQPSRPIQAAADHVTEIAPAPSVNIPKPTPSPSDFQVMQKLLAEARDWRAFALSAMQHPEQGGLYYAMYVTNLCGRDMDVLKRLSGVEVSEEVARTGTVSAQRISALEQFFSRCSAFIPNEAGNLHSALKEQSAKGDDPLVDAERKLRSAYRNPNDLEFRAAAANALKTNDPLLLSQDYIMIGLMTRRPSKADPYSYWFDGKVYDAYGSIETSELLFAVQLGVCRDNIPCALDDKMMLSCLGQNECITNRADYIKNMVQQSKPPINFDKILDLASKVKQAIASQKVEAFVRP